MPFGYSFPSQQTPTPGPQTGPVQTTTPSSPYVQRPVQPTAPPLYPSPSAYPQGYYPPPQYHPHSSPQYSPGTFSQYSPGSHPQYPPGSSPQYPPGSSPQYPPGYAQSYPSSPYPGVYQSYPPRGTGVRAGPSYTGYPPPPQPPMMYGMPGYGPQPNTYGPVCNTYGGQPYASNRNQGNMRSAGLAAALTALLCCCCVDRDFDEGCSCDND